MWRLAVNAARLTCKIPPSIQQTPAISHRGGHKPIGQSALHCRGCVHLALNTYPLSRQCHDGPVSVCQGYRCRMTIVGLRAITSK